MKRIAAMFVALLLLAAPMTALAHGHCSSSKARVCTVRSCRRTGTHRHNGRSYRAHYNGDGHSYHRYGHH